jgi:hypothetical protein
MSKRPAMVLIQDGLPNKMSQNTILYHNKRKKP